MDRLKRLNNGEAAAAMAMAAASEMCPYMTTTTMKNNFKTNGIGGGNGDQTFHNCGNFENSNPKKILIKIQ